jgi:hypothetical protein
MRVERIAFVAGAVLFAVPGAWALLDPRSFYDQIAHFPPYNRHFVHDLGAFQLGLGTAMVLGLAGWDARRVVLWSAAVATVLHALSHWLDRDLGGRAGDPITLSVLAAAFVAAAFLGEVRRRAPAAPPARLRPDRPSRPVEPSHR